MTTYQPGDFVGVKYKNAIWPARVVAVHDDLPQQVLKVKRPNHVCLVQYFGDGTQFVDSSHSVHPRFSDWITKLQTATKLVPLGKFLYPSTPRADDAPPTAFDDIPGDGNHADAVREFEIQLRQDASLWKTYSTSVSNRPLTGSKRRRSRQKPEEEDYVAGEGDDGEPENARSSRKPHRKRRRKNSSSSSRRKKKRQRRRRRKKRSAESAPTSPSTLAAPLQLDDAESDDSDDIALAAAAAEAVSDDSSRRRRLKKKKKKRRKKKRKKKRRRSRKKKHRKRKKSRRVEIDEESEEEDDERENSGEDDDEGEQRGEDDDETSSRSSVGSDSDDSDDDSSSTKPKTVRRRKKKATPPPARPARFHMQDSDIDLAKKKLERFVSTRMYTQVENWIDDVNRRKVSYDQLRRHAFAKFVNTQRRNLIDLATKNRDMHAKRVALKLKSLLLEWKRLAQELIKARNMRVRFGRQIIPTPPVPVPAPPAPPPAPPLDNAVPPPVSVVGSTPIPPPPPPPPSAPPAQLASSQTQTQRRVPNIDPAIRVASPNDPPPVLFLATGLHRGTPEAPIPKCIEVAKELFQQLQSSSSMGPNVLKQRLMRYNRAFCDGATGFASRLLVGDLSIAAFLALKMNQLVRETEERRELLRQKLRLKFIPEEKGNVGFVTCIYCGSDNTTTKELQTRGGDEPMTVFATCHDCKKQFRAGED